MRTWSAELLRGTNRATAALVLVCLAGAVFVMVTNAPTHPPLYGFRQAAILVATLLMCRTATVAAGDFGAGTIRPWLISAPARIPVFLGKLAASVSLALAVSVITGAVAYVAGGVLGDVPGPVHMVTATAELGVAAAILTVFGHAAGMISRSIPVALAITLGWVLPVEKTLDGHWPRLEPWLPAAVVQDITHGQLAAGTTWAGAIAHAAVPFLALDILALILFCRRDITS